MAGKQAADGALGCGVHLRVNPTTEKCYARYSMVGEFLERAKGFKILTLGLERLTCLLGVWQRSIFNGFFENYYTLRA